MAKRYFSPSLIIGFGPKAEGIISQMHRLMSHWESSKRNLVQTVLAKSPVGLWLSLQAAVDNLKDAERISKAEQEPELFIRRDSGPMEINVFLLGEIGTVLNGLCLDNILRGVISLRFSWGAELGFTGANITTIGLVAGNQTPSRLVLHRMLELYKSEEFLDSFGGRIFVVDNGLRDGSRISWQDLSLALARVIYLSISPGTEPLLLPQLGLIRKHERDTKLATLGITCFESPRDDSVLIEAAKYLEEMARHGSASLPQITPSGEALLDELEQLWVRDGFDSQRELSAKLRRGVEGLLAGGSPIPAALAFIDLVHKRISTVQEQGAEISDPIEAQVEKRASLPAGHGKYPRLPLLLFGLFVPVAIYALASQSVSGSWLVWSITGIAGAALLSLGIMAMRKTIRKNPQEIVVERWPNMTGQEVLLLDTGGVEELRKECRREEADLSRLARTLLHAAADLKATLTEDSIGTRSGVLNKLIPGNTREETHQSKFTSLLPLDWRDMEEEQLRRYLTEKVSNWALPGENHCCGLGPQEWQEVAKADPEPLLVFRESGGQLRKISLIAAKVPKLPDCMEGRGLTDGDEGWICLVNLFLGIDPKSIVLNL